MHCLAPGILSMAKAKDFSELKGKNVPMNFKFPGD